MYVHPGTCCPHGNQAGRTPAGTSPGASWQPWLAAHACVTRAKIDGSHAHLSSHGMQQHSLPMKYADQTRNTLLAHQNSCSYLTHTRGCRSMRRLQSSAGRSAHGCSSCSMAGTPALSKCCLPTPQPELVSHRSSIPAPSLLLHFTATCHCVNCLYYGAFAVVQRKTPVLLISSTRTAIHTC